MDIILTHEEIRVLGSLMEKEMATPEYYPLTLKALINSCNQKTSRSPVVLYEEKTVLNALKGLQDKRLIFRSDLSRAPKYEQTFTRNNKLIKSEAALLCVLMLRGPQTIGELKIHTERLYVFDDMAKVDETLNDLMEAGYLVKLPRMPGQKESRYTHLLSGRTDNPIEEKSSSSSPDMPSDEDMARRITRIEEEMNHLRQELKDLNERFSAFMEQFS